MKFNVAVIDSYVDLSSIDRTDTELITHDVLDNCGDMLHGSYVLATLLKYTDKVERVHSYNVFGKNGYASGIAVIKALEDILSSEKIAVVMMSLTLTELSRMETVHELCSEISRSGTLMIAAGHNRPVENTIYFPAYFDEVIGVLSGSFRKTPFFRCTDKKSMVYGDASPEFIRIPDDRYILFGGTSKAVPKLAAHILNTSQSERFDIDHIYPELKKQSAITESPPAYSRISGREPVLRYLIDRANSLYCGHEPVNSAFSVPELRDDADLLVSAALKKYRPDIRPDSLAFQDFRTLDDLSLFLRRC